MDFNVTLGLLAAFVAAGVFCGWRGSLPSQPAKGVRMIPWRPLMVASAVGALVMLVHLANLAGIKTGR
ncbi:MAG TPA: hypothetical protein VFX95_00825 [Caulobacteraceae bacterium]|nr:hypothetical protein [Caulobacteraceae bacterium]